MSEPAGTGTSWVIKTANCNGDHTAARTLLSEGERLSYDRVDAAGFYLKALKVKAITIA